MSCSKNCGRPAQIRGLCRIHYNALRKYEVYRQKWRRYHAVGTMRRLRALIAIGYTQAHLAAELNIHPSYVSKLIRGSRDNVNATTAERVAALYDKLSMTPGPSQVARDGSHRKGWMPPLAWDDDTIDDPDAQADPGHQEKVGFSQRFLELREIGLTDLVIADKWKIQPASLLRQLERYDIKPEPSLVTAATSTRRVAS